MMPHCGETPLPNRVAWVTRVPATDCRVGSYARRRGAAPFIHHVVSVDEVVLRAPPALDRVSRASFRRQAREAIEARVRAAGGGRLVVDLSGTRRVDSAGLGVLILLHRWASELRQPICLRGASEELRFLLVLTRFDDRFEFEAAPM
jgi:anti-anti-sigma regulatory factor